MLRRLLIFLFYCLFVLIVVGVLLVLLFPRDKFLGWVSTYLGDKLPGVELSVSDLKYVHPLKLRLYELNIRDDQGQWELPLDTLLVSVEPRYPVEHIGVIGVLFGGDLSFNLALGSNKRLELRDLHLSEMHLSELRLLEQAMERPVEGIASLSGRATVSYRRWGDIRFTGTMRIENLATPLRRPVLEETEVRFDRVSADLVVNAGVVDITDGTASGPLLNGSFSAIFRGTSPLGRSQVNVRGSLVPQPSLVEKHPELGDQLKSYFTRYMTDSIPFRIDGTLAEPQLKFEQLQ